MTKQSKYFFIVFITLTISSVSVSFSQDSIVCKKTMLQIFSAATNSAELLKSGVFIDYKSTLCFNVDNNEQCGNDSAQLIIKESKSALVSGGKKIYRDDSTQVVINALKKQIIVSYNAKTDAGKISPINFTGLHDSVFRTTEFENCQSFMQNNDSCLSASLVLAKNIQQRMGVKNVQYKVNKSRKTLIGVSINYADGNLYKRAEFEVKNANYHYKKDPFKGNALAMVFDKKGELLKEYEGYSIRDFRKSKKAVR